MSRRALLASVAATGGAGAVGLVIGFRVGRGRRAPLPPSEPGNLRPNAWLEVTPEGRVIVWVAKSEMGQGVHTSLAQLVVDQLGARWADVEVRQAPTDLARFGWQGTHSSTSVRASWDTLQEAGAHARALLVAAAARAFDAPEDECRVEDGEVVHGPSGRRVGFGPLAPVAAGLDVARGVVLAPAGDGSPGALVGTSPARLDLDAKITGRARFGTDVRWPGMWYAAVARCPFLTADTRHPFMRGALASADRNAALAVPGVREIVQIASGLAVVATSTHAALAGRAALAARWDERGRVELDDASAARHLAGLAADDDARAVVGEDTGDAARILASTANVLRREYQVPFLAHVTLEPMNASARPVGDRLEVLAPVQNPHGARDAAARAAAIAPERVDVRPTYLGGGFGRRAENDFVEEAAELASRLGRPVQVVWDRADDLAFDFHRPAAHHALAAALGPDGLPIAWLHRIASPSIVAQRVALDRPMDPTVEEGAVGLPYALGARRVVWVPAELPVRIGFWRSVGHSHNAFAVESFVDELAQAAGADPFEFRMRLLADRPRERRVLERVAAAADWGVAPSAGVGRGIAFHTSFGSHVAAVVEVRQGESGPRATRIVVAVDCGRVLHPDLATAQIEGGALFGLSAALTERVTLERGAVTSTDLARYRCLRLPDAPPVEVHLVPSGDAPGGIGEISVPPIAPALAAAWAAADGPRRRALPLVG